MRHSGSNGSSTGGMRGRRCTRQLQLGLTESPWHRHSGGAALSSSVRQWRCASSGLWLLLRGLAAWARREGAMRACQSGGE
jgi:hypothetical protein